MDKSFKNLGKGITMKIIICGMSGSGKDFARDYLINKYKLNPITSHTSRPMRSGETQGIEYYFVSYNEFLAMDYMNEFVEMRSYATLVDNKPEVWNYGTTYTELSKDNFVGIKCLVGAKAIKKAYPETIVIHIHADDNIREARARLRGSFDETEWKRRLVADAKDFPENEVTKVCDYFITNNLGEEELKQSLAELMYVILQGNPK